MGDVPPGAPPPSLAISAAGHAHGDHQNSSTMSPSAPKPPGNSNAFYSQLDAVSQGQLRSDLRPYPHSMSPQYPTQEHGANPLSMGSMVGALPEYSAVDAAQNDAPAHQHTQQPLSGSSASALVYQIQQQNIQSSGHAPASIPIHSPYGSSFTHSQLQQNYASGQSPQHANYPPFSPHQQRLGGPNQMQNPYQQFVPPSQYMYYSSPYGAPFSQAYPTHGAQPQAIYGRRPSLSNIHGPTMGHNGELPQHDMSYTSGSGNRINPGLQGHMGLVGSMYGSAFIPPILNRPGPINSIPRGPPRKPKQSGHALWVGNLPPGTTVDTLKDHFSRDATRDIESLFLISKSNCAFVNYRTETSCTAAMHRFHDSRFNGVRLVCRLRRGSTQTSGVPIAPSAMLGNQPTTQSPPRSPQDLDGEDIPSDPTESSTQRAGEEGKHTSSASEKYFIVKSLTLQDLELSVRNGIWATQSHNEETLNKAFHSAANVYLIFSANKSGEYFGYARMTSPILEDATRLISSVPKPDSILDATDVPKSIPTPATEFAPKGRIIDDSARGTIFWEAQLSDTEGETEDHEKDKSQIDGDNDTSTVAQSWGKPFKIEWISTNRLPFYRTRGLRNPWNANREVKIARDGTELETSVGERLTQMFHRLGPSSAAPVMQSLQPGLSQMRPY